MRFHETEKLCFEVSIGGSSGIVDDEAGHGALEAERVLFDAECFQTLDIDVGADEAAASGEAFALGKQGAVLVDKRGASPDKVLG